MVGRCAGWREVSSAPRASAAAAGQAGGQGRGRTGLNAAGEQCRAGRHGYAGRRWPPVAWRDG